MTAKDLKGKTVVVDAEALRKLINGCRRIDFMHNSDALKQLESAFLDQIEGSYVAKRRLTVTTRECPTYGTQKEMLDAMLESVQPRKRK